MMPVTIKSRLVAIHQVAQYLSLSPETLYKMVSQRRIPYVKVGRLLRFDLAKVDQWLKQNTVMPMPQK